MFPILLRLLSSGPDILFRYSVYHEKKKPYPTSVSEPEDNHMKRDHEKEIRYPISVSEPEDNNALKGSKSMNTSRPETE